MALSGSFSGGITGYTVRTEWKAIQNIDSNYSDLTITLYLDCRSNYDLYIDSRTHTITINGSPYPINSSLYTGGGQSLFLGEITKRIYHNPDGTCNVNLSSVVTFNAYIHGSWVARVYGGSDTIELDKIPRMSTISNTMIGTKYLNTPHTIHIQKQLTGNVTHDVWYILKGEKGETGWYYIARNTKDLDITFVPTDKHINLQPNNNTIYMDIGCKTYKDGKIVGENTYNPNWHMKVPKEAKPTIENVEIVEADEKTKQLGVYVQNHSKINIKTNAVGFEGSTIKSVKVEIAGQTFWGANTTSSEIMSSGNVDVKVTVTDSRDRTNDITKTVKIEPYFLPSIVKFSGHRLEQDEKIVTVLRNFKMASIDDKNTCIWKTEKRLIGSSSWTTIQEGTDKTLNSNALVYDINSNYDYEFRLTITDYYTSATQSFYIGSAFRLINFHASGTGMGIGQISKRPNAIDVNIPVCFKKGVEKEVIKANLENGWINATDPISPLRFFKDVQGVVHLQGVITGGKTNWGTTIFTLPESYRPSVRAYGVVLLDDYTIGGVRVETDGRVRISGGSQEPFKRWTCFDGITFFTEE